MLMHPRLIGLYSESNGAGKTSVATILNRYYDYHILSFAEPIKGIVQYILQNIGYTYDEAYEIVHEKKDKELKFNNRKRSVRYMLRTLGTEWGRDCIDSDLWLILWKAKKEILHKAYGDNARIVIDDVRCRNEAEFITSLGGELWKVERTNLIKDISHKSEDGLKDWNHFSYTIYNTGTSDELHHQIWQLLS